MWGMIKKFQLDRHNDDLINASLYYLRARTIRDKLDGLEHIEALMHIRGLDPAAIHVPRKNKRQFRNGEFRKLVLDAIKDGCDTPQAIVDNIGDDLAHLRPKDRSRQVKRCLETLEGRGVVRREGRAWRLNV